MKPAAGLGRGGDVEGPVAPPALRAAWVPRESSAKGDRAEGGRGGAGQ